VRNEHVRTIQRHDGRQPTQLGDLVPFPLTLPKMIFLGVRRRWRRHLANRNGRELYGDKSK
jgi:hypothetical protein